MATFYGGHLSSNYLSDFTPLDLWTLLSYQVPTKASTALS